MVTRRKTAELEQDVEEASPRSAKRDHLLDVAQRLFSRHGFHAVGIDTVLAEAGVAKMTLYKHFSSKDDLIEQVLRRRSAQILGEIQAEVAKARGDAAARIVAVFEWLETWIRSPQFEGCLFIKAAGEFPESDSGPRKAVIGFKSGCADYLRSLCEHLGLETRQTTTLARRLALLVEGAMVLAFIQRDPQPAADARAAARALIGAAIAKN